MDKELMGWLREVEKSSEQIVAFLINGVKLEGEIISVINSGFFMTGRDTNETVYVHQQALASLIYKSE